MLTKKGSRKAAKTQRILLASSQGRTRITQIEWIETDFIVRYAHNGIKNKPHKAHRKHRKLFAMLTKEALAKTLRRKGYCSQARKGEHGLRRLNRLKRILLFASSQ